MNRIEKLGFNAKIIPVKPLNDSMTLCKCYVMALGKNRNYSNISKEVADNALPTIYNIPVVGNVFVDDDGDYRMGGHDLSLVRDENGKLKFKSLCVPFGTVPQQDDVHYEDFIDSNGNNVTYQVADIILWTGRYPDLLKAVYDENIYFGQSMEIDVKKYEPLKDDNKYTDIKNYSYSALCLLGKSDDPDKHVEPCFPDARVEPYHFSYDDMKFAEMMNEFKEELSMCFQAINTNKGGEKRLTDEVCNSVLSEFGLIKEDLKFEITENMTEDELRENLKNHYGKDGDVKENPDLDDDSNKNDDNKTNEDKQKEEPESESEGENNKPETSEDFKDQIPSDKAEKKFSKSDESLTYGNKFEKLQLAASNLGHYNEQEETGFDYWLNDCDDNYAYLTEYVYGKNNKKRNCRVQYEITSEGATFVGEFETVVLKWMTEGDIERLEAKNAEYDELKSFQKERLENDRINEYEAVVAEFSDLTDNEEFSKLVEDKMSFETAEALREKCFAIRGKSIAIKSVAEKPNAKVKIDFSDKKPELYGGFFSKYPPKSGK